jgi:uncharacterized spore protein YtfJ
VFFLVESIMLNMNYGGNMENVEKLLKTSLDEVDRLLSSKTVVGEPIKIGEDTVVPLLSLGFGFGAGGGKGTDKTKGSGEGGGSGAGAGIKPVALIISDGKGNTRVEPITGPVGGVVNKLASSVVDVIKSKDSKEDTPKN